MIKYIKTNFKFLKESNLILNTLFSFDDIKKKFKKIFSKVKGSSEKKKQKSN